MIEKNTISQNCGTKCAKCKKSSLILTNCLCTKQFCLKCRYPEDHQCTFNHKEKGMNDLIKNNPIVAGEKISKI